MELLENFVTVAIPVIGILIIMKILSTPIRWFWKLLCHVGCGFGCLFVLNLFSGYTGIVFPLNLGTAAISGFLGAPGVLLLVAAQYFL